MNLNSLLHLRVLLTACLLLAGVTGCKKLAEADPPKDLFPSGMVFSNDSTARASVTGLYIQAMRNNLFILNGGLSVYAGLSADELVRTTSRNEEDQFAKNGLLINNTIVANNFWRTAYITIYQANACVEGLSGATHLTEELKSRLIGEAKFMRALNYWHLVNLFGDIPLTTTTDIDLNAVLARAPVQAVQQLIEKDLLDAWSLLPDGTENTTPDKSAAAALLARVYCYQQNWTQAEIFATKIISKDKYALVTSLDSVFSKASTETIFQLAPVLVNNSSSEGATFIPQGPASIPTFVLTDYLLAAFEPGDMRRNNWVKGVTVGAQTYYYPYKYRIRTSSSPATEYNVVLRLAEQYLIRAEARAKQNNSIGAIEDINIIRGRAGLTLVPATSTPAECLGAVEKERRVELFSEWGHRWFDLKRTNNIDNVLLSVKGTNWQSTDQFYPIPISEIQKDPYLVQNQGY